MASTRGLEPPAHSLGNCCSILMSYVDTSEGYYSRLFLKINHSSSSIHDFRLSISALISDLTPAQNSLKSVFFQVVTSQ